MSNKVGTQVYMTIDGVALVGETSLSFKSAQTMIETSSKASGKNSEFKGGRVNRTFSVSSIASTDPGATGVGFEEFLAAQDDSSEIDFLITKFTGGGYIEGDQIYISGKALPSNVTWDAPDNDKMTFSCDLQITDSIDCDLNATVAAPTATSPQALSIGDTIEDIVVTATLPKFYLSATSTTPLPALTVLQDATYYISDVVDSVESTERTAVTVTLS